MQTVEKLTTETLEEPLIIAGKKFTSRLMTGTGKYSTIETMQQSIEASGCEILTVAVRRVQTKAPGHEGLAEAIDWQKIWMFYTVNVNELKTFRLNNNFTKVF